MKIIIYCGNTVKTWHPGSYSGGSEEATILLAKGLANRGHDVTVYNCIQKDTVFDNVLYKPYGTFNKVATTCDVYFGLRDWSFFHYRYAPLQILLCHDIPVQPHFPNPSELAIGALDNIDYVNVLNDYHAKIYQDAGCPKEKLLEIPIIIEENPYKDNVERNWFKCIWLAHPNRGLRDLQDRYWRDIKKQVPEATLQPCWWDVEDSRFFIHPNEELGILPTKICNQDELAKELVTSFVFPYCCTFSPEISPASCLKSVNAGVQPVLIPKGGIKSTMKYGAFYATEETFVEQVVKVLNYSQADKEKVTNIIGNYGPLLTIRRPDWVVDTWERVFEYKIR